MKKLDENDVLYWIFEYSKRFDDQFPNYMVSMSDEETIKAIKKCLEENKPYEIKDAPKDAVF